MAEMASSGQKRTHAGDGVPNACGGIPVTDFLAGMPKAAAAPAANQKLRLLEPAPLPAAPSPPARSHGGIPVREFLARHAPEGAGVPAGARVPRAVVAAILDTLAGDDGAVDAAELISRVRSAAAPDGGAEYRMDGDY